jgi:hypothetical protein
MDIKIESAKIQIGMFVSELDRPWEDTTFMFQGFLIDSEQQIELMFNNKNPPSLAIIDLHLGLHSQEGLKKVRRVVVGFLLGLSAA